MFPSDSVIANASFISTETLFLVVTKGVASISIDVIVKNLLIVCLVDELINVIVSNSGPPAVVPLIVTVGEAAPRSMF